MLARHQPGIKMSMAWHILQIGLPILQVVFGIIEDLAGLIGVLPWWANIAWNNGSVIEEVEETTAVAGEDDLFLGSFDGGSKFGGVGFLQLLAGLE
jgi:hypothetical protein